jgi:hypothetical protein
MKNPILLFISFVSLTTYSYCQPNKPIVSEGLYTKVADYAELILSDINKKPTFFRASFEYTTSSAPIQGEKCSKKALICNYRMTVPEFVKQMEIKGWQIISSSVGDGGGFTKTYQYLFRKK